MSTISMEAQKKQGSGCIRVALTEKHGMAVELSKFPPSGVEYSFIDPIPCKQRIVRSPIKGYLGHYSSNDHDLIEAILSLPGLALAKAINSGKFLYGEFWLTNKPISKYPRVETGSKSLSGSNGSF